MNAYPDLKADAESFTTTLINAVELTGNKFVVIIDEWDVPVRETNDYLGVQREYLILTHIGRRHQWQRDSQMIW